LQFSAGYLLRNAALRAVSGGLGTVQAGFTGMRNGKNMQLPSDIVTENGVVYVQATAVGSLLAVVVPVSPLLSPLKKIY